MRAYTITSYWGFTFSLSRSLNLFWTLQTDHKTMFSFIFLFSIELSIKRSLYWKQIMNFFLDFPFFFLLFNKSFHEHRFNPFAIKNFFRAFDMISIEIWMHRSSNDVNFHQDSGICKILVIKRLLSFCFRNPLIVRGEIFKANYNICICIISIEWVATEKNSQFQFECIGISSFHWKQQQHSSWHRGRVKKQRNKSQSRIKWKIVNGEIWISSVCYFHYYIILLLWNCLCYDQRSKMLLFRNIKLRKILIYKCHTHVMENVKTKMKLFSMFFLLYCNTVEIHFYMPQFTAIK